MGDRQLVCCPKSGTSSLGGSVFYVLLTFFPFRYPLQIPLSRPKFEVLLPLQPGFYIIVSKCVQAIGTIIWKCSKENRDVRDLPDRQRFFRVIGTIENFCERLNGNHFQAMGTIETIQMVPEFWYSRKDRTFEVNKYFVMCHFFFVKTTTACKWIFFFTSHIRLCARKTLTVTHNACEHCGKTIPLKSQSEHVKYLPYNK